MESIVSLFSVKLNSSLFYLLYKILTENFIQNQNNLIFL